MKKYLIALALVGFTTTSCYEKLNITPPSNITDEQIKELLATADDAKAAAIMGGIANGLPTVIPSTTSIETGNADNRYYRYMGDLVMRSLEGNDMIFGATGVDANVFGVLEYQLSDFWSSAVGFNKMYWTLDYQMITSANKVLNMLDDKTVGTNATLKKYQGWGCFIRAFGYNDLLENYQLAYTQGGNTKLGVPYYDRFDPGQAYRARATMQACYDSINKDLNKAIAALSFTTDKSDIDAGVAYFLKARVALCMGNWAEAITACNQIITNSGASLMNQTQYVAQPQYPDGAGGKVYYYAANSGFLNLEASPECLYGWNSSYTGGTNSYWLNSYGWCTGGSGNNYARIDDRLYNKIDSKDFRKDNFLATSPGVYEYDVNTKNKIMAYANTKFASSNSTTDGQNPAKANFKTNSVQTDWVMMRLSEVYLMKAEAEAQSGTGDAKATLNVLLAARTKAGEPTLTCDNYASMAGLSALEMVQLQTRIEMWGEKGLEFFNNKRWNVPVNRTGSTVHWQTGSLPVANMRLQMPLNAMNFNGLLVQD